MKVFVVDDEPIILKLLEHFLKREPTFHSSFFSNPVKLFHAMEGGDIPDFILSDIKMPHLSGFDVIRKIHAEYGQYKISSAYCSAFNNLKTALASTEEELDQILAKPFYVKPIRQDIITFIMEAEASQKQGSKLKISSGM